MDGVNVIRCWFFAAPERTMCDFPIPCKDAHAFSPASHPAGPVLAVGRRRRRCACRPLFPASRLGRGLRQHAHVPRGRLRQWR
ncbi:hypothetical protein BN1263250042 [Stenotrophomonas indicatrix]|nr:hypothetical protein BN1263250042 [Stenotrophomonas indicatrix]